MMRTFVIVGTSRGIVMSYDEPVGVTLTPPTWTADNVSRTVPATVPACRTGLVSDNWPVVEFAGTVKVKLLPLVCALKTRTDVSSRLLLAFGVNVIVN